MTINVTPIPKLTEFATPAVTFGTSAAAGVATSTIRSDSGVIAFNASVPDAITYGQSGGAGSVNFASRIDHLHAMAAATTNDIAAQIRSTSDQTIANATNTIVTFDAEVFDTDGMATLGTNDERLTIQTAGKYLCVFSGQFAASGTGYREAFFYLNNSTATEVVTIPATSGRRTPVVLTWVGSFSVDDYIQVQVSQSSGGNLSLATVNPGSANLTAIRISF